MLQVACLLCKEKGADIYISSNILSKNPLEELTNIGNEILIHLDISHKEDIERCIKLVPLMNGFMVMKFFQAVKAVEGKREVDLQSEFEKEKERMRDVLAEEVMWGSAEDDEEDDFDFDDEESDEDDNDDEEDDCEADEDEDEDEEESVAAKEENKGEEKI